MSLREPYRTDIVMKCAACLYYISGRCFQADAASGFVGAFVAEETAETGSDVTGAASGRPRTGRREFGVDRRVEHGLEAASRWPSSIADTQQIQSRRRHNGKRYATMRRKSLDPWPSGTNVFMRFRRVTFSPFLTLFKFYERFSYMKKVPCRYCKLRRETLSNKIVRT